MAGLMFTISLLAILTIVGFLFAWMVHLASRGELDEAKNKGSSQ